MIRSISLICGLAAGAVLTTKTLDYLENKGTLVKLYEDNTMYRNGDYELVLTQVLFRHGARTPLKLLPGIEPENWSENTLSNNTIHVTLKDLQNRPLPEEKLNETLLRGGAKMGQLTIIGQQEMCELGKSLRQLYVDKLGLLNETFNPEEIYLRTTHIPRTIDSLRSFCTGLYPKMKEAVFWTLPVNDEILFPNWQTSRALKQYIKYCFENAQQLDGYQEDLEDFFKIVGKTQERLTFLDVMDNLKCRQSHNKKIPKDLKKFIEIAEQRALQMFNEAFLNTPHWTNGLILPLSVGEFVQEILRNIENNIKKTNNHKMYLYSVHDTSLFLILTALKVKIEKWPFFSSHIIIELYRNQANEYFVQLLYNGEVLKLKGSNDEGLLTSKMFEKLVNHTILVDFTKVKTATFHIPRSKS